MGDQREAGRKADAHRIRDLYRGSFASTSKAIARDRVVEAFRAAGVRTVLDLWGGGISAAELTRAGFRVISVDDGSMELADQGRPVTRARKRRALEYTGREDGYETRFGKVETFAAEADAAYLDFCGPWTANTRRAVAACRHMTVVAVTLTPDHDTSTDASNSFERQMAYQMFLKMAWSDKPRWESMSAGGHVRRLLDYRRPRGFAVYLYLLSRKSIHLPALTHSERAVTKPEMYRQRAEVGRTWYLANREKVLARQRARPRPTLGPFSLVCHCGTAFVARHPAARSCSKACRRLAVNANQNRRRELSGVSGTPDEAISD